MIVILGVIGTALLATLLLIFNRPMLFIYALAISVFAQNITAMLLLRSGIVPIQHGAYLLYLKELIVVLGLIYLGSGRLLSRTLPFNWIDALIILYFLLVCALFTFESFIPFEVRIAGMRGLVILPSLYLLGRWLYYPRLDISDLSHFFIRVAIVFALFGILEAFILPESFWLAIGQEEYYLMKEGRVPQGSLYLNMYFWDFGEPPVRRVASVTGDPLLSSYTLLYGTLLLGFWMFSIGPGKLRVGHLVALLTLVTMIATFSRGAVVTLLGGILSLMIALQSTWIYAAILITGIATILAVVGLFGDLILQQITGRGHIEGALTGLATSLEHPFGIGIGLSSNVAISRARALGIDRAFSTGGDSYFGSVASQIGIIGVLLAYSIFIGIAVCLYRQRKYLRRSGSPYVWIYTATIVMLSGLIFTSLLNESGFSFVGSGLIFLTSGILVSHATAYSRKHLNSVAAQSFGVAVREGARMRPQG